MIQPMAVTIHDNRDVTGIANRKPSFRRWLIFGEILAVLLLVFQIQTSETTNVIEQRLTGQWTQYFHRDDGTIETWLWDFRSDGTVRNHPVGQVVPENAPIDSQLQWNISDGCVILSWDHFFTRDASIKQRMRQTAEFITTRWNKNRCPLKYSDCCLIQDNGGNTITLSPLQTGQTQGGYIDAPCVLTRRLANK